jgi:hypothetical protein
MVLGGFGTPFFGDAIPPIWLRLQLHSIISKHREHLAPHVASRLQAEPHVLLGQLFMQKSHYDEARAHAQEALRLFCLWGTAWDKRMAWDAW